MREHNRAPEAQPRPGEYPRAPIAAMTLAEATCEPELWASLQPPVERQQPVPAWPTGVGVRHPAATPSRRDFHQSIAQRELTHYEVQDRKLHRLAHGKTGVAVSSHGS